MVDYLTSDKLVGVRFPRGVSDPSQGFYYSYLEDSFLFDVKLECRFVNRYGFTCLNVLLKEFALSICYSLVYNLSPQYVRVVQGVSNIRNGI